MLESDHTGFVEKFKQQVASLTASLEKIKAALPPPRGTGKATKTPLAMRKAKSRRINKAAKQARKKNRRNYCA